MPDFTRAEFLTFDCYGTLIDWENGILSALRPIVVARDKKSSDAELLELYGDLEMEAESGPYQTYRDVLQSVVRGVGKRLNFTPTNDEVRSLPDSLKGWQPFPDTVEALRRLAERYKLVILSNVDDDLFAHSQRKLKVQFYDVITAQQAQCYKPALGIFKLALQRLKAPIESVVHVGQSIYHDVIPARSLGLETVWVNRPSPRPNAGATKRANAKPDLEVSSLRALADVAT